MRQNINKALILNKIKNYLNFRTEAQFADFLGLKRTTLSSWYSRNSIDYELLYEKCGEWINPDFLLGGSEIILREQSENGISKNKVLLEDGLTINDLILKRLDEIKSEIQEIRKLGK